MLLKRIMPCLLIKDQRLVKTINFKNPKYIGDPINAVKIYNEKGVDEIVILDINATRTNSKINFTLVKSFAEECFMPVTYGGGVKSLDDFTKVFNLGVEKIIVNSLLLEKPEVVKQAIDTFGSQSILASVDVVKESKNNYKIFSYFGKKIDITLEDYLEYLVEINVGELLVTSVQNEGTWEGFDRYLYQKVNSIVNIPIIANGGCGSEEDLIDILYNVDVQAASLGSMAVYQKKSMGVLIRFPNRGKIIKDE